MAIQVYGNWDIGYVMDRHTSNSEYLGDDAYGHPMFDTTYTELGELVHKLKYRARYDVVEDIINNISEFIVDQFADKIDCVISVPPTNNRIAQPAFLIAEQIAELLHCSCRNDILENVSTESAKTIQMQLLDQSKNCWWLKDQLIFFWLMIYILREPQQTSVLKS